MSHDATKVVLGNISSSSKEISEFLGSPVTYKAGLAIRLKSDDTISLLKADGQWLGVSVGKGLSDSTKSTGIARDGLKVPVLLKLKQAYGTVEITSFANLVSGTDDVITVGATAFTFQAGAATPGQATAQAASSNAATATSLAAQINAHATAGALVTAYAVGAIVTIISKTEGAAGNETIALTYTDNDTNVGLTIDDVVADELAGGSDDYEDIDYVAIAGKAYFDDVSGKVGPLTYGVTISDATFVSGVLTGIQEDGTLAPVALVDMPGGL
jgi:hypothetical protein